MKLKFARQIVQQPLVDDLYRTAKLVISKKRKLERKRRAVGRRYNRG